jgi:carbon-monoxide dehydrogenase large subunit
VGPYRGAGRPEGNYYMERLVDAAAAGMGIDRLELRRRNHIDPAQMPYKAASDMVYDSGEFANVFEKALEFADAKGFPERKKKSLSRGRLRGLGIGSYLEVTAPPNKEMGGIRFEKNGDVTIISGTLDYGQGHAAPFAQVLAARLGVPFERIRLRQSDSDEIVFGGGTGGSRSMLMTGAAIAEAAPLVIEKGRALAAETLEAAAADIEFHNGNFVVGGTDRKIGIMALASKHPGKLDVSHVTGMIPSAFPNGCHVAEVEIDPETGVVTLVNYTGVDDVGTVINPMICEGQIQGGIAQGLGQALLEAVVYERESGQLLSGSFVDYAMPRADDFPHFALAFHPVPSRSNPLGVKGAGESGAVGAPPAVVNAILHALRPAGVTHLDMPATPERVWRAMRAAKS